VQAAAPIDATSQKAGPERVAQALQFASPHTMATFFARILIVPAAHSRIFDMRLQATMYDVFHRDWRCRWGHRLATPVVVLGLLTAAGALWPAHAAVPIAVVGAVLVALWLKLDRTATLLAAPALALLGYAAYAAVAATAQPLALGLGLVVAGGVVQAGTHLFEPVPPPLSGCDAFVDGPTCLRRRGLRGLVAATALWLGVYWWLEVWAATRVFLLQWQQVLFACGARPSLAAAIRRESDRFHAAPTAWCPSEVPRG
jgi:uncharacterized membrane protein YGL010W